MMQYLGSEHYVNARIMEWKREGVSTEDDVVSGIMFGNERERLVDSDSSNVLSERLCLHFDRGRNVSCSSADIENCRAIRKLAQDYLELCQRGAATSEHRVRSFHVTHRASH